MIIFSNGHRFQFMTASGALAFDGKGWPWEWPLRWIGLLQPELFTIVTKTLTRQPREGNLRWSHPWTVVKKIGEDGMVNAIGLTNPGIEWWIREIAPHIPKRYQIIVSLEAVDPDETMEMVAMLNGHPGDGLKGIELNLSCPNSPHAGDRSTETALLICEVAARVSPLPLIAKLSYTHDYVAIAKGLQKIKKMEALSINSIPWRVIFPHASSPLEQFGGGGVSGKSIQSLSWKMMKELSAASTIPVIGPSVWDYEDIRRIFDQGAKAVSFGSVFVHHPWRPTQFVRRWLRERENRSASS